MLCFWQNTACKNHKTAARTNKRKISRVKLSDIDSDILSALFEARFTYDVDAGLRPLNGPGGVGNSGRVRPVEQALRASADNRDSAASSAADTL